MAFRKFLPGSGGATDRPVPTDPRDTETVRRIAGQLDALPVERARYLAAFAYILTRAAAADLDISHAEVAAIEQLVAEHGDLPEAQAVLVAQIARNQSLLYSGTEDYLVTRQFRELASTEDKLALLRCCYLVGRRRRHDHGRGVEHVPADREGARPRPRRGQRDPQRVRAEARRDPGDAPAPGRLALPVVYLLWIAGIAILYPLSAWYRGRRARRGGILRYL